MKEHYTDGRRWSYISNAWIFESGWNDKEEIAWLQHEIQQLRTPPAALSSGYVQVPVEPTQDWLDSVANRLGIGDAEMRELHSALLAATPTPSDSKPGEGT